jgi:hypothetical protein
MDINENLEIDNVDYARSEEILRTADALKNHLGHYGSNTMLIVVGCGGIGFWAGIYASMLGFFETMVLFDADTIDATNLVRLPVPGGWIGTNKAVALRKVVHQLRPSLPIVTVMKPCSSMLLNAFKDHGPKIYVLDCTDDARAQNDIYNWAKRRGNTAYVKAGYEGMNFGIYTEINTWVPADYRPGYTTAASNVLTSAAAASYAVTSLVMGGNTTEAKFSLLDKICTTQRQGLLTKAMTAVRTNQPINMRG